jgi:hypothetical protein
MTSNSRFKIGRAGATLRSSLGSQLCRLSVWGKWDIGLSSRRQNNATWIDVLESETAVITRDALDTLGLQIGDHVVALIKATDVMLIREH